MFQVQTRRARQMRNRNPQEAREINRIRIEFIRMKKLGLSNAEAARIAQGEATETEANTAIARAKARKEQVQALTERPRMTGAEKRAAAEAARRARAEKITQAEAARRQKARDSRPATTPAERPPAPPKAPRVPTEAEQAARSEVEARVGGQATARPEKPAVALKEWRGGAIPEGAENGTWPDVLALASNLSAEPIKNRKHAEAVIREARDEQGRKSKPGE